MHGRDDGVVSKGDDNENEVNIGKIWFIHDLKVDSIELSIGMIFPSLEVIRKAVSYYKIRY